MEDQKAVDEMLKPQKVNPRVINVLGGDIQVSTKTRSMLDAEDKIEIMIPSTETQRYDVDVQINGIGVTKIMRDRWVKVPKSVVLYLQNLVQINYIQKQRPEGQEGMELIAVPALRFPFQMRMPEG